MQEAVESVLKKHAPHKPIVTGVGVAKLAIEGMRIEVEVSTHIPPEK